MRSRDGTSPSLGRTLPDATRQRETLDVLTFDFATVRTTDTPSVTRVLSGCAHASSFQEYLGARECFASTLCDCAGVYPRVLGKMPEVSNVAGTGFFQGRVVVILSSQIVQDLMSPRGVPCYIAARALTASGHRCCYDYCRTSSTLPRRASQTVPLTCTLASCAQSCQKRQCACQNHEESPVVVCRDASHTNFLIGLHLSQGRGRFVSPVQDVC